MMRTMTRTITKVKIERIKKGLTQKQLREILKISPNSLVKIEKGDYSNLTFPIMKKISAALDSTPQELFFQD